MQNNYNNWLFLLLFIKDLNLIIFQKRTTNALYFAKTWRKMF